MEGKEKQTTHQFWGPNIKRNSRKFKDITLIWINLGPQHGKSPQNFQNLSRHGNQSSIYLASVSRRLPEQTTENP